MGLAFTGWELPEWERRKLAQRFPPAYAVDPDVRHHVTFRYGVNRDSPLPAATSGFVVGHADDLKGVRALVAEIDGGVKRPDGSIYHISWSLDWTVGRQRVNSNAVFLAGWQRVELSNATVVSQSGQSSDSPQNLSLQLDCSAIQHVSVVTENGPPHPSAARWTPFLVKRRQIKIGLRECPVCHRGAEATTEEQKQPKRDRRVKNPGGSVGPRSPEQRQKDIEKILAIMAHLGAGKD
jgi:hypothetical protein